MSPWIQFYTLAAGHSDQQCPQDHQQMRNQGPSVVVAIHRQQLPVHLSTDVPLTVPPLRLALPGFSESLCKLQLGLLAPMLWENWLKTC